MALLVDLATWLPRRHSLKRDGKTIGFVPTMGALHRGHQSLLERARRENDIVVLSIYINPTQFDNADDLKRYPVTLESDRLLGEKAGADFILAPKFEEIYPDKFRFKVTESDFSRQLCGAHRPGHFDGVLTVVMKLLNIVGADRAYFGEKDHQQLQLVQDMAAAFFIATEIVACPTVREQDGLALSSRNVHLTKEERARAPAFQQALRESESAAQAHARLREVGFKVDYIEDVHGRRYGAVQLGAVRLIDNVQI